MISFSFPYTWRTKTFPYNYPALRHGLLAILKQESHKISNFWHNLAIHALVNSWLIFLIRFQENKPRLHGSFHCIIFQFISNMKKRFKKRLCKLQDKSYKIMQLTVLFNHNMLITSLEISPLLQGQWVKVFENNCPLVPATMRCWNSHRVQIPANSVISSWFGLKCYKGLQYYCFKIVYSNLSLFVQKCPPVSGQFWINKI